MMFATNTQGDAAVKYILSIYTFIILGPTKSSVTEDKSFAEKSGN